VSPTTEDKAEAEAVMVVVVMSIIDAVMDRVDSVIKETPLSAGGGWGAILTSRGGV
jgi:hypothetical protein